jgi:hypothetical protein
VLGNTDIVRERRVWPGKKKPLITSLNTLKVYQ